MSEAQRLADEWYEDFNTYAGDLYPGHYTHGRCLALAEQAIEIQALAGESETATVVHNYIRPEFHRIADRLGDSLGLAQWVAEVGAPRVVFVAVFFMAATSKITLGDKARVFALGTPKALGCSLVSGTDYEHVERWKRLNPGGVLVTYVNSSAYLKSISEYICTSGNADRAIARAYRENPGAQIYVLPDKFLGLVMKSKAADLIERQMRAGGADDQAVMRMREDLDRRVEIYTHHFQGNHASCYVHEQIGDDAPERALEQYPDAELMIHPECGCATSCLHKLSQGILPKGRVYYCSTEQMVTHARQSPRKTFVVATETGLIYRLRREMPDKEFFPVSQQASCRFMKAEENSFEVLLATLRGTGGVEIVICDDCAACSDFRKPYNDGHVAHIPRSVAERARLAIDRMLTT